MASSPEHKPTSRRASADKTAGKSAPKTQTAGRSSASAKKQAATRTSTLSEKKPGAAPETNTVRAPKPSSSKGGERNASPRDGAPRGGKLPRGNTPRGNTHGDSAQQTIDSPRHTFSEQFMPYILAALALFFGACFVCDAIGDAASAEEHLMGVVGYYICRALFGVFGWPAYLIPALILLVGILWKRYSRDRVIVLKATLSLLLVVLISTYIHVAICAGQPAMAEVYDISHLFTTGADLESGGVIGGLLGFVCYRGLRLPGTVVLAVITLPLVLMCLVGVTPGYVFGKLSAAIRALRARRAEERQARAAEAAVENTRSAESYRARRAREAAAVSAHDISADDYDEAGETCPEAEEPARRRTVVVEGETVDFETGEVLDAPAAPTKKRERTPRKTEEPEEYYAPLPLHEPAAPTAPAAKTAAEAAEPPARAQTPARRPGMADGDLSWEDPDEMYEPYETDETDEIDEIDEIGETDEQAPTYGMSPTYDTGEIPLTSVTRASVPGAPGRPLADPAAAGVSAAATAGAMADAVALGADAPSSGAVPADSVDLDGDADLPSVEGTPTSAVSFAVVTDGADPAADGSRPGGRQIDVLIHKQDTAAVMAEGLGDQEVIIPTASNVPVEPTREYVFPPMEMLTRGPGRYETNDAEIAENTQKLRDVLESFRIGVREIACSCGPTITRFEVKPDSGIRVRSIVNLVDDISMGLAKGGVRIEAPIPGKSAVGIEVPNASPAMVYLRNILETPEFRNHKSRIAACLGADVAGRPVIFDIQAMPHMLIAGATGTGKSVCINSIIMSILYRADPAEVKLILIDPKKVEFAMYRDLPHLYAPVVSDPKKAAGALNSAVNEMERRFELIEEVGVRNIAGYNKITEGDPERPPLPQMVIIIDELADLMMTAPAEVETAICRLAQKARAAGIHLVVGTQRPSVDVITGLIKANIPSRIAFAVSSAVDSKIILESTGADKLIGRGDMLFSPIGANKPVRVQGAFVSEAEVEQVVTFIKEHNEKGTFNEDFTREIELEAAKCGVGKRRSGEQLSIEECDALGMAASGEDPKFWEALEVAVGQEKIGTSALQRKLNLGYGRAAKIIDRMEELGFVGPDPGTKQGRKVILTAGELAEYRMNGLPGSRRTGDRDE